MLDFKKFWSILVLVLVISFSTNSYAIFTYQSGMGLDIIQGKDVESFWIFGDSCGESQIFITDNKGNLILSSPIFDQTNFFWEVDVSNWSTGEYDITAQSEYCVLMETVEL